MNQRGDCGNGGTAEERAALRARHASSRGVVGRLRGASGRRTGVRAVGTRGHRARESRPPDRGLGQTGQAHNRTKWTVQVGDTITGTIRNVTDANLAGATEADVRHQELGSRQRDRAWGRSPGPRSRSSGTCRASACATMVVAYGACRLGIESETTRTTTSSGSSSTRRVIWPWPASRPWTGRAR